jgi:esterase/lipase
VKNEAIDTPPANEQRRAQLQNTALTAWDLRRSVGGRLRDVRVRQMALKTHDRLRWLEEAELGVARQHRSFFRAGVETAPAVLLIHDVHQSPADLHGLAQVLGDGGLTVHGLLLAGYGHGMTERPQARWRATLQQVRLGYQLLADTCREVHVVGVGFGAALALHLAARVPVAGLILVAPDLMPQVGFLVRWLWKLRLLRLVPVRRRLGQLFDASESMQHAQTLISKLKVPIYGVQCDDDDRASPQSLRLLQKRARHPQCRFQAFAEGGHDVLAAHGPTGLSQEILRFIKG